MSERKVLFVMSPIPSRRLQANNCAGPNTIPRIVSITSSPRFTFLSLRAHTFPARASVVSEEDWALPNLLRCFWKGKEIADSLFYSRSECDRAVSNS